MQGGSSTTLFLARLGIYSRGYYDLLRVMIKLAAIEAPINITTAANETAVGTWYQGAISIFIPMNVSTIARPYLSK